MWQTDFNGAKLGFEEILWQTSDKLRGNTDSAEYKNIVLGLVFLKFLSDIFEERRNILVEGGRIEPKDNHGYEPSNGFRVPVIARWQYLHENAKSPAIGKLIDDAMVAIESENASLKDLLPKNYSRPELNKQRLGGVLDLINMIGLGDQESRSRDILGRVYEYFLGKFAAAEGKLGGEFYTPRSVVQLLVEMIEPLKGRVYDPCCGSGGMFVQSDRFVEAHGGQRKDLSVFGQESNATTWRLAKMNLAIRGIEANLGEHEDDSFHNDMHKGLQADYILANPPFNMSDWDGEKLRHDARWKLGTPPIGNANFAWVQHFLSHLSVDGVAGFVLSNGALSSNQASEYEIRRKLVDNDLIECIVYLPPQLFYTTQISVSLWFITRNKHRPGMTDRRQQTLFIYAYGMGTLVDRTHRELTQVEIQQISSAYRRWKGTDLQEPYSDIAGLCRSASIDDIRYHRYAIVPGRYVGFDQDACTIEDDLGLSHKLAMIQDRFALFGLAASEALSTLEGLSNG